MSEIGKITDFWFPGERLASDKLNNTSYKVNDMIDVVNGLGDLHGAITALSTDQQAALRLATQVQLLQSDSDNIKRDFGTYVALADRTLTATISGKYIDSDGELVTSASWNIAKLTDVLKGNTYELYMCDSTYMTLGVALVAKHTMIGTRDVYTPLFSAKSTDVPTSGYICYEATEDCTGDDEEYICICYRTDLTSHDPSSTRMLVRRYETKASIATNTSHIGVVSNLNTTVKDNLVNAVNEIYTSNATVTSGLSAEITRATSAESTLTSNLSAEVTRATAAELANTTLITLIRDEVDNLISDIDSEPEGIATICGLPAILIASAAPSSAVIPYNWNAYDSSTGKGAYWIGVPVFEGLQYININASSGGRYFGVRTSYDQNDETNYNTLKWI